MSTETRFETFWTTLSSGKYEIPEEMKEYLFESLKGAGFFDVPTIPTQIQSANTVTKPKKLTGYNVFMKNMMTELREQNVPSGERMGKVASKWKEFTEEEKNEWRKKASEMLPVNSTNKSNKSDGRKKISGYQLYIRETMPSIKINTEIPYKQRMTEIGKMWKGLENGVREAYNIKAKELPF